jgi:hypothetical protein
VELVLLETQLSSRVLTASRAELLRELGHRDQARAADRIPLELTATPPNRPSSSSASPGPSLALDPAAGRSHAFRHAPVLPEPHLKGPWVSG